MTGKKGRKCSILHCRSFQHTHKHMSFFRFPKDPERCKAWIAKSGRPELSEKLAVYEDRVCEKHFEPQMFLNDYRNRLQHSAVPVLFLDEETDPAPAPKYSSKVPSLPSQPHQRPVPKLETMRPAPKKNTEPDFKRFKPSPPEVDIIQVMQPKPTLPPVEPMRKYARIGPTKQIYMEAANEVGTTGMSYRKAAEKFNINAVNLRRFCIRLAKTLKPQATTPEMQQKQILEQQQLEQYLIEQQHMLLQQQLQQKQLKHARQRKSFTHQTESTSSKQLPRLQPNPMHSMHMPTVPSQPEEINTPSPTIYKRPRQIFSIDQEEELAVHVRDTSNYYGGMSSKDVRTLAYVFGTCNQVDMPTGWQETHQASFDWCLGFIKRNKLTPMMSSKSGGPGRPPAMIPIAEKTVSAPADC